MKYIPDYMKFINERVNLKAAHLSSDQYQKAKKLKAFSSDDWVWNSDTSLYDRVDESAIDEAAKIETERYVRSHGKKPKGYGGWMFSYNRDGSDIWEIPNGMSWPDAQKWAKKKAKEDGEDYIYVMENVSITEAIDYKDKEDTKHKVKATVCYIKAMSGKRECKDLYFKSMHDALGFKDNVKGFPKGAEVESIVTEGAMSDIHMLASEAKDEADFIKKFFATPNNPIKKTADNIKWVKSLYKDI